MKQLFRHAGPWAALVLLMLPALAMADMTFKAADGEPVHTTLTQAKAGATGQAIALLFHQAGGNRHEYDAIAPRLNAMGFDTLALDQRSGGSLFNHQNQTVQARGSSGSYGAAYADLEGALSWAQADDYKTIVAVGSSYSASLTLRLAAQNGQALTAAAVFSPGEYFDDRNVVKQAVARIRIPVYITTGPDEQANVDEVLQQADSAMITRYQPTHGVHGASTLDPARDPAGARANWASFSAFMARYAPTGG